MLLDHGVPMFVGPSSEAAKHYYRLHQGAQVQRSLDASATIDPVDGGTTSATLSRPPAAAFIDLRRKSQIGIDGARCTGVAVTDRDGHPKLGFQQGEVAVFFTEYEIEGVAGVPLCGVLIKNDRGVIVHGKNAWQFDDDVPVCDGGTTRVTCRHEIALELAQGDYVFEVGLAMVTTDQWTRRESISHDEMSALYMTICQVAHTGVFSVGLKVRNGVAMLTHHGIADLPGRMETAVASVRASALHG